MHACNYFRFCIMLGKFKGIDMVLKIAWTIKFINQIKDIIIYLIIYYNTSPTLSKRVLFLIA